MEQTQSLLYSLSKRPLVVVDGIPLCIPTPPELRGVVSTMLDLLDEDDRLALAAIASACSQLHVARRVGVSQPSMHYRLLSLHRWLTWVPARRRVLERHFGVDGIPDLPSRERSVDLHEAWRRIVWQHEPLLATWQHVGSTSQGHLRHIWLRWLDELTQRPYAASVLSVIADLRDQPCYWRRPSRRIKR